MLNNRDEKYEGPEESEYHFSDDEVSYEVEPEAAAKPAAAPTTRVTRMDILNRLTKSKRMLISLGVFLVLIFVVYKMVAPSSTTPTTQITPAVTAQNNVKTMPTKPESNLPPTTPSSPMAYNPATSPSAAAPSAPPTAAIQSTLPQAPSVVSNMQAPTQMPVTAPTQTAMTAPVNTTIPPAPIAQQQPTAQAPIAQQQPMQPTMQLPANMPVQPVQQATMQPTTIQPVVTQVPASMPTAPIQTVSGRLSTLPSQTTATVEAQLVNLASQNQQLMTQLQADYTQKINNFSEQTKTLQDQVVALNTRVASMEKEINQLVQALTHQGGGSVSSRSTRSQPAAAPAPEVRIPYNVQAIIPGRAWLRADNGETVTVAEGDVIKDLGRVTKIDPYDGIVEVNTGSKMISLSYGTGG